MLVSLVVSCCVCLFFSFVLGSPVFCLFSFWLVIAFLVVFCLLLSFLYDRFGLFFSVLVLVCLLLTFKCTFFASIFLSATIPVCLGRSNLPLPGRPPHSAPKGGGACAGLASRTRGARTRCLGPY